jgi:hypothetical protein
MLETAQACPVAGILQIGGKMAAIRIEIPAAPRIDKTKDSRLMRKFPREKGGPARAAER